jgi:hypothetical protein
VVQQYPRALRSSFLELKIGPRVSIRRARVFDGSSALPQARIQEPSKSVSHDLGTYINKGCQRYDALRNWKICLQD